MKILIIEDEKPAFERLSGMVKEYDQSAEIPENLTGIKSTVAWFTKNKQPDLILLDIQLSDGLSLEIFNKLRITCPVIFTTAYDEYILEAFSYNGIDYLLKPVKKEKLFAALEKYKNFKEHFSNDYLSLFDRVKPNGKDYKERFTVKNGTEFLSVNSDDIAYFFTEYKLTFLITTSGKKYLYDKNLAVIEEELNPKKFYRINRNYLISVNSIKSFKSFFKGKLLIELSPPVKEQVFISQEKATGFKVWLEQ